MTATALHNRCWNHDAREAVCRCPECRRSYCRECVTEHQSRLLCAECLRKLAAAPSKRASRLRRLYPALTTIAGLLLAWAVFYTAGKTLTLMARAVEQSRTIQ